MLQDGAPLHCELVCDMERAGAGMGCTAFKWHGGIGNHSTMNGVGHGFYSEGRLVRESGRRRRTASGRVPPDSGRADRNATAPSATFAAVDSLPQSRQSIRVRTAANGRCQSQQIDVSDTAGRATPLESRLASLAPQSPKNTRFPGHPTSHPNHRHYRIERAVASRQRLVGVPLRADRCSPFRRHSRDRCCLKERKGMRSPSLD